MRALMCRSQSALVLAASILLLFQACGKGNPYSAKNEIIAPYVAAFKSRAREHNTPIPSNFNLTFDFAPNNDPDFKTDSLAFCQPGDNWGHIKVNEKYWHEKAQEIEKHMILAHELTHCYFRIGHLNSGLHIMNSQLPHAFEYSDELWESLFLSINSSLASGIGSKLKFFDPLAF